MPVVGANLTKADPFMENLTMIVLYCFIVTAVLAGIVIFICWVKCQLKLLKWGSIVTRNINRAALAVLEYVRIEKWKSNNKELQGILNYCCSFCLEFMYCRGFFSI